MKILFLSILTITLLFNPSIVLADILESPNYRIEDTNFNTTSGQKSSPNFKIKDTIGQTASNKYKSTGYILRTGYQYLHSMKYFRFSVSSTSIDFGSLEPDRPATASALLTIYAGDTSGYRITAIADGPLRKNEKVYIPDTKCDDFKTPCDTLNAKPWTIDGVHGFGYNIWGWDTPDNFETFDYYRPFPSLINNNAPVSLMQGDNIGIDKTATLTLKVNVGRDQNPGQYQSTINLTAIPTY